MLSVLKSKTGKIRDYRYLFCLSITVHSFVSCFRGVGKMSGNELFILFTLLIFLVNCYLLILVTKKLGVFPVGIWCLNDVVSTSMRRDHVASTLI